MSGVEFKGYAASFNTPDGAGDVIEPGAFTASLATRQGAIPLFWQHQPHRQVGAVEAVEDERGLLVSGTITDMKAAKAVATNAVGGLSFGYRAKEFVRHQHGRQLRVIELIEVSIVTYPLQENARITSFNFASGEAK